MSLCLTIHRLQRFVSTTASSQIRSRNLHVGIVGMPNVGKSTLFNALTRSQQAQAANYPFCTIEPNAAKVSVPDPRLHELGALVNTKRVIEAQLEFVDIAGLVKGASRGEGLGNKFLDSVRQSSVIAHVLRCFDDPNIIHVDEAVDPLRDLETIETELILSDLNRVEKMQVNTAKKARSGCSESKALMTVLPRLQALFEEGQLAYDFPVESDEEQQIIDKLQLITAKKALYICNVGEDEAAEGNEWTKQVEEHIRATRSQSKTLTVSASLEEAAAGFDDAEGQLEYLSCCGLTETGLTQIIRACREMLHLQSYYTVGEKETRAWTIQEGTTAASAAGVIHSDFERLFIRAETISYNDFIQAGSAKRAKDMGLMRTEGRDYVCQEGDCFNFLIGK